VLLTSKKKAPAVGAINTTIEAGLEIMYLVLDKTNKNLSTNIFMHVIPLH
jgi:hypothetical protein